MRVIVTLTNTPAGVEGSTVGKCLGCGAAARVDDEQAADGLCAIGGLGRASEHQDPFLAVQIIAVDLRLAARIAAVCGLSTQVMAHSMVGLPCMKVVLCGAAVLQLAP